MWGKGSTALVAVEPREEGKWRTKEESYSTRSSATRAPCHVHRPSASNPLAWDKYQSNLHDFRRRRG